MMSILYWFAHISQHVSGDMVDVCMKESYFLRTTTEIGFNKELFVDYKKTRSYIPNGLTECIFLVINFFHDFIY
jgi:hypothetical protein